MGFLLQLLFEACVLFAGIIIAVVLGMLVWYWCEVIIKELKEWAKSLSVDKYLVYLVLVMVCGLIVSFIVS